MIVDVIEEWGSELLSRHHRVFSFIFFFVIWFLKNNISFFLQLTINRVDACVETVQIGPHCWRHVSSLCCF